MEFIDLKAQQDLIKDKVQENISKVMEHGRYIMGPEIYELEEKLADYIGVKHCITVSSGTDALLVSMMALGIKADDEFITTPFTFISTCETIALLGAKPVFVDIDPATYNIDSEKIEAVITEKTKVIMPVSLYGQCADLDKINKIASINNLNVIEDAAQSFGATYKTKKSCSLSDIGCTSFFPSKPLGCYGDGGACFTNDDSLAEKIRQIRVHGQDKRYHHPIIGINGRMDTIQAAVLLAKFDIFPAEVEARRHIGNNYTNKLTKVDIDVVVPFIEKFNTSVFAQYSIQVSDRDKVINNLNRLEIPTAVHYPVPIHAQPAFDYLINDKESFSNSDAISKKIMSLPMHPYLTDEQQQQVVMGLSESLQ